MNINIQYYYIATATVAKYVCTLFNSIRALNDVVEARGYGLNGSIDVKHSRT